MKVKVTLGLLSALMVSLFAAAAFADDGDRISAKIPFAFTAGQMQYPAGTYTFVVNDPENPNVLTIESANGKRDQFILARATETETAHYSSAVVFDKIGSQYFLVKAYNGGALGGLRLTKSEIQNGLERGGQKAEMVEIAGHLK